MWRYFFNKERARKRAARRATSPVMKEFLSYPHPAGSNDWQDVEIVSLDLETTGLNPGQNQILSYGSVTLHHGEILLQSRQHRNVFSEQPIPEASVVIHQITDDQSSRGEPLAILLPGLLQQLAGKVMLVHFAAVEQGFLDAACQRLYGSPFIQPTIDTLVLAERLLSRRSDIISPGRLRLFQLREEYGLPRYKAHNALKDALGTAELLLAITADISAGGPLPLKSLLR